MTIHQVKKVLGMTGTLINLLLQLKGFLRTYRTKGHINQIFQTKKQINREKGNLPSTRLPPKANKMHGIMAPLTVNHIVSFMKLSCTQQNSDITGSI